MELMDSLNLDFSAAGMEGGDTLGGGRKTTESSSPPVSHEARMLQATEHLVKCVYIVCIVCVVCVCVCVCVCPCTYYNGVWERYR